MKKGSSGNRRRPPRQPQQQAPASRYPTRDNVYSLQQERQRRQAQEVQRARNQNRYQQGYPSVEMQPAPKRKNRKKEKKRVKKRLKEYW